MSDVEREIAGILTKDLAGIAAGAPLTAETPLIEGGLNLDSVNLLELLVRIEETFGVTVEDEDIRAELFTSIGSLADFVRQKQAARPPGARSHPG
jgi:acyl carrier protein